MVISEDRDWLLELVPRVADFLQENLKLQLHPQKLFIKTLASGVDFLGWVHFPDNRVLRMTTKRRMLKKLESSPSPETIQSYHGLLAHGNTRKILKSFF